MATYNKRGYKAPKPEVVTEVEPVEETFDGKSTTAEVFNALDETASKTEDWVAKNQKGILVGIGVVTFAVLGYFGYSRFVDAPKENTAAEDMFQAQQYFEQAVNAPTASDSLFNLALKGGEGKLGFVGIIENHAGTDAANLAEYYAGTSYLNIGKYKEAVEHLEKFSTKDEILDAMAKGATGDAFAQLKDNKSALEFYEKAAKATSNDLVAPRFLFKAGQTALALNQKADALKYFKEIQDKYSTSAEGASIDAYVAMAE
ncbi:tetratricopeptide repeat protein [Flavobacterium suzhouense]|uniref:Tol-pal system YbgF family protein n=1 Tax=Flavobacterium suzhouense TaxID=1529638 RepID=A0ABW5NQJ0_9FLAO